MGVSKEKLLDDEQRLLAMREYLGIRAQPRDVAFDSEVVAVAVGKIEPIIARYAHAPGEVIVGAVAKQLGVRFEEVRSSADIQRLEQKYLVEQKELGFGLLAREMADETVDALLFQRMHAAKGAPDEWVAVLNMTSTEARAYWSRPHELTHRLAEPPQRRLPFYRHRTDFHNRLERIIDLGAAEIAFPASAFGPRVKRVAGEDLTWEFVKSLCAEFAPTCSLLSAAKAILRFWPQPAFLVKASFRGRRSRPHSDKALRIDVDGFSPSALQTGVHFYANMRVPPSSPIAHTHETGRNITDVESLGRWVTSSGSKLPDRRALTSGLHTRYAAYGLVSLL